MIPKGTYTVIFRPKSRNGWGYPIEGTPWFYNWGPSNRRLSLAVAQRELKGCEGIDDWVDLQIIRTS